MPRRSSTACAPGRHPRILRIFCTLFAWSSAHLCLRLGFNQPWDYLRSGVSYRRDGSMKRLGHLAALLFIVAALLGLRAVPGVTALPSAYADASACVAGTYFNGSVCVPADAGYFVP